MVSDRAYLRGARQGAGLTRLEAEVARIGGILGAGTTRVEPAVLQPAEVLLDLYGEDIRARAFVTRDDEAEMMLRPDFTVPIVQLHMEGGAEPAAYSYCGPVWRRQAAGSGRPREYLQAGIEFFGGADPAEREAEVLLRILAALGPAPVDLVTGDMGLVLAAVDSLATTPARRAALRRHVWRPGRFQVMLARYGREQAAVTAGRAEILRAEAAGRVPELIAAAGSAVGLRDTEEVAARIARLAEEAGTPPLDPGAVAALEALLALRGRATGAVADLRAIARDLGGLARAVDRLERRLEVFAARGIPVEALGFEASFGRTSLEYYDGFVFGALARGRTDLPTIASGGRYDTLTGVLGQGRRLPAVGGIVRPEALLALVLGQEEEAQACG